MGLSTACGSAQTPNEASESEDVPSKAESRAAKDAAKDKDPVSGKGKSWGGWRRKGKRDKCFYVHENKCFETEKQACKAAACGDKECRVVDGAPADVKCSK
ncbi:MAG: hypothetical protein JKY56_19145 [Kofleriaceae bacterium]|nr:hypothetical protein [Kofleriaceae bacterium]